MDDENPASTGGHVSSGQADATSPPKVEATSIDGCSGRSPAVLAPRLAKASEPPSTVATEPLTQPPDVAAEPLLETEIIGDALGSTLGLPDGGDATLPPMSSRRVCRHRPRINIRSSRWAIVSSRSGRTHVEESDWSGWRGIASCSATWR